MRRGDLLHRSGVSLGAFENACRRGTLPFPDPKVSGRQPEFSDEHVRLLIMARRVAEYLDVPFSRACLLVRRREALCETIVWLCEEEGAHAPV